MKKTTRMKFDVDLWKKMLDQRSCYEYFAERCVIFGLDRENGIAQIEIDFHQGTLGYDGLSTISKQELDEFGVPFRVGSEFELYNFTDIKNNNSEIIIAQVLEYGPIIFSNCDLLDENYRKEYENDKSFSAYSKMSLFPWTDEDKAEVIKIKIGFCKHILEDKNSHIYKALQDAKRYREEKKAYQEELKRLYKKMRDE